MYETTLLQLNLCFYGIRKRFIGETETEKTSKIFKCYSLYSKFLFVSLHSNFDLLKKTFHHKNRSHTVIFNVPN